MTIKFALLACLLLLSCTASVLAHEEGAEETGEFDFSLSQLQHFFEAQGLRFGPTHDWDSIDSEPGPFVRAHEAVLSAKQGQDSAVSSGIAQSANFRFPKTLNPQPAPTSTQYYYSRINNPNFEAVERQIGAWYDVRHQSAPSYPNDMLAQVGIELDNSPAVPPPKVVSFASGMGAIAAVIGSLVKGGDRIVIANELYYEVPDLGDLLHTLGDIKMISVDMSNIDKVVEEVADTRVKILYFESASNPHGRIPDFDELIKRVRAVNEDIIVVVDNTWTTPVVFQPFAHDIDVVVESATKYLSGKGDAVLGAAIVYNHGPVLSTASEADNGVSADRRKILEQLPQKLRVWRRLLGSNPAPMNAWLISKGLETLQLRMEHLSIKAPEVADFLMTIPAVTRVHYCGHHSHPHNSLANKYFHQGFCSGVLSFHLPLKTEADVEALMRSASPFVAAPSFGEANTLVMWPRNGSSANFPGDKEAQVPDVNGYWFRFALGLAPGDEIKRDFFRWITRQPTLTRHLASVDYASFSRSQETGEVLLELSRDDWATISAAPEPLFMKRQELADIDATAPHVSHPTPIHLRYVKDVGVDHVQVAFDTSRPARIASHLVPESKYIISSFIQASAKH